LLRELPDDESESSADIGENEGDDTNSKRARARMAGMVEAGLRKIEKEAAAKHRIEEGMRVVSSVKGFVGTALKYTPEAAAAWGGVCLLLQVRVFARNL